MAADLHFKILARVGVCVMLRPYCKLLATMVSSAAVPKKGMRWPVQPRACAYSVVCVCS